MGRYTNPHGYTQPEAKELSRAAKGRPADSAGSQTLYKSGAKGKLKIMRVGGSGCTRELVVLFLLK
jgi:hypothetical protein